MTSLYRELTEHLPYDPTERAGVWGARRAEDPRITPVSLVLGGLVAVALIIARLDWGAALFGGLVAAVGARAGLLTWRHLASGGWRAWRARATSTPALDACTAGTGIAVALFLTTGGGGVGPALPLAEAALAGLFGAMLTRALLTIARWP